MIFRRRKRGEASEPAAEKPEQDLRQDTSEVVETEPGLDGTEEADTSLGDTNGADSDAEPEPVPEVTYDRSQGPFDVEEVDDTQSYVNFGSLLMPIRDELSIRLDVEGARQRIVAVTIDGEAGSSLQVQAFAAPRTEGLWQDVRRQIRDSVASQDGQSYQEAGRFGWEVHASVPADSQDGAKEHRAARFLGVDGPRWFLRAMLVGPAATEPEAAAPLEELFRSLVVVRGDAPMPPRELLPLQLPEGAREQGSPEQEQPHVPLGPVGRGPEITEIG